MGNRKPILVSEDGRYKLLSGSTPNSDDFYGLEWKLLDTRTGKKDTIYSGSALDAQGVYNVEFSPDSGELLVRNKKGGIVEQKNFAKLVKSVMWD